MTAQSPIVVADPAHWRQRAEDARREAEQIHDPATKSVLIEIAAAYDYLAVIIEVRSASKHA